MQPTKKELIDYALPILGILFVLFLSLHLAVAYDQAEKTPIVNSVTGHTAFNGKEFLSLFIDRVTNKPTEIKYAGLTTIKFLVYGAGFILFCWAYITTTRKKLIPGKEFGTAQWAKSGSLTYLAAARQVKIAIKEIKRKRRLPRAGKKKKIAAAKAKYIDSDILLTKTDKVCMYNREINNNVLIIGGSGSGKTRSYVLPNILQAHGSYIITDPKGEIFHKAAFFLERIKHYKIRVLNLDMMQMSDGYNPFYYIHMDRPGWEERVLTLIETLIINTDGGEKRNSSDPFWEKAERLFLQSLFFAVLQDNKPEEQTINHVLKLMGDLQLEDTNDAKNSKLDQYFEDFAKKYTPDHIAVQQYREFRDKAGGLTAKSIVISASARLSPFRISEVRRIFSRDNMRLDRVGEEKTAIFVIVPPTNKTFSFVAGMLFTQLFQELNYCALNVHMKDGQLPVPCRFILDEFANTCVIPNFVQMLAYARSLGIGITTILQSLEQIKKMYKDEWGVIVDNSNSLLYLGSVSHVETLEYLSKSLGKATYDKKDYSRSRGRHGSSTTSNARVGRELMLPDEIRNIKKTACILLIGGKSPYFSQKYSLKLHRNYKYTSEADEKCVIDYTPQAAPEKQKELKPAEAIISGAGNAETGTGGALDGIQEAFKDGEVVIDTRKKTVIGAMNSMRQSNTAEFSGIGLDEDEEREVNRRVEIDERLREEKAHDDKMMDLFTGVGVSTEPDDVRQVFTELAEGEAKGAPMTFANTTYTEDGDVEIEDAEIVGMVTDYDTIGDNDATEEFQTGVRGMNTDSLQDGKHKNFEREIERETTAELFREAQ